jgi:hypothetical protein
VEKMNLYLRLREMSNQFGVVGEVASIMLSNIYDDDATSIEATFTDLYEHGCVSGMIGEMIYYKDTEQFFDKYEQEVQEKLVEYGYDRTHDKYVQFLEIEYLSEDDATYEKNEFAWFLFESVAFEIGSELGIN